MTFEQRPHVAGWIAKVAGPLEHPDKLVFLAGYWGDSSVQDCLRYYSDPSLRDYIDIPIAAIRLVRLVPEDPPGLGYTQAWIDADARLYHGPADGTRLFATYAEGRQWARDQGLLLASAASEENFRVEFSQSGSSIPPRC